MPHNKFETKLELGNRALLVAALLLAAGLALTAWISARNDALQAEAAQQQYAQEADRLEAAVQARLRATAARA